ncbi:MAG TPA: ribonuclease Z [Candidatus Nanoarchaeia archaeon]|nr:ribonuclease Z [Candidatus Nanoarchaeia archaeon]
MAEKIAIRFLGTADAIPSIKRNHTSILINYKEESILIDCGEGTQRQFKYAKISPSKITRLLISHWHGDHVLGIPGLLQTMAFSDYNKTLHVYGPKGTKKYMDQILKTFVFYGNIKINVQEIDKEGVFFDNQDFYLEASMMTHGTPCIAYNFIKKGILKINKQKLKKSGLPQGPILKKIKEGQDIIYNGKKFRAKDLTYSEDNKKISIILDTSYNEKIPVFVKSADLMISESNFASDLESKAKEYKHLTAKQVAEAAKKAKVKSLILTHISQRYEKQPKKILNEAKKIFKKVSIAKDLDFVSV